MASTFWLLVIIHFEDMFREESVGDTDVPCDVFGEGV